MNNADGHVYCVLFTVNTTVCSQNINKLIVNITDENPTDYYSFLSRFHLGIPIAILLRALRAIMRTQLRVSKIHLRWKPCITKLNQRII